MTALRRVLATAGNPDCGRLGHELIKGAVEFPLVVKNLLGLQPRAVSAGGAHTACLTGLFYQDFLFNHRNNIE